MKENLDKLEQQNINAENQKAVMTATLQITVQEKERLLGLIAEKDHTLDLLSMDKVGKGYRQTCFCAPNVLACKIWIDESIIYARVVHSLCRLQI